MDFNSSRYTQSKDRNGGLIPFRAQQMFERARRRAILKGIYNRIRGLPYELSKLSLTEEECEVGNRSAGHVESVPISQILGSVGKSEDFDLYFNPLHNRIKGRWMQVFTAWENRGGLPAVELIQVYDKYYVVDGHHRVSVAHALGYDFIDADVTVWKPINCVIKNLAKPRAPDQQTT